MSFMNLPVPNVYIDLAGLIVLVFVIFAVLYKIKDGSFHHFYNWRIFDSPNSVTKGASSSLVAVLLNEVFVSRNLGTCDRTKRISHITIFWGFVFLAISTTLSFFTNPKNLILPLYNPVKIFGNAGGILIVIGFVGMFYARYREHLPIWRTNKSDFFVMVLFLSVITGFVTQQTIYSSAGAYWISGAFWIHLILVTLLLVTAPYTKFLHSLTKPVSLFYEESDRRSGVESALPKTKE